ncbi:MAG: tyrosine--tRNA ligase [Candidatus Wildermuthbacteria bacterium]|nr:tyrosine--tRNA ligase [Candidatus Wildermuthbacteria bacterium]
MRATKSIEEVLNRRVEKVLPTKEGLAQLMQKRAIRLYQGFDPTGSRLHLGHSIGLRKLMDFANLGHEVIFLFGTGTVLVGDPSLRDSARKAITQKEIEKNIKDWKRQAEPLVDFKKVTIKQNGDWLLPLTLKDIIGIASNISALQLFKRDMFQRRLKRGDTVWYHETMYPLLQGYDSVAMDVDLEVGGTDQEFNMLVGRDLQRKMNNKEKYILTTPMILGTDGKQMSKSSGNCVWLDDTPQDMFGKIMSMPDSQTVPYLTLVTDLPLSRVEEIGGLVRSKEMHPMEAKRLCAWEVVKDFYGRSEADKATEEFRELFHERKLPQSIPGFALKVKKLAPADLLCAVKLASSKGNARRLIEQGGVKIDGLVLRDEATPITAHKGMVIQVGKRRYATIL